LINQNLAAAFIVVLVLAMASDTAENIRQLLKSSTNQYSSCTTGKVDRMVGFELTTSAIEFD